MDTGAPSRLLSIQELQVALWTQPWPEISNRPPSSFLVHLQSPQWMGNLWAWGGLKGSPARFAFALAITWKRLRFFLIDAPQLPLILGHPWLKEHNPHVNWRTGRVLGWSPDCAAHMMESDLVQHQPLSLEHPAATSAPAQKSPSSVDPTCSNPSDPLTLGALGSLTPNSSPSVSPLPDGVPAEYAELSEVFSKQKAFILPPHRPYDCSIILLPGTAPPRGRRYSLSRPETSAMTSYIDEALAAGFICPSTSPAGAVFFFVGKKDGGLRPWIDYRGLNSITVKNRYPLPLMSTAFEQLQGATFFIKLDLRNAYNLVRIQEGDEWTTAFNTPRWHYECLVMPFRLSNAPAVFQAFVNDVLREMLEHFVYVYLDDILIFF